MLRGTLFARLTTALVAGLGFGLAAACSSPTTPTPVAPTLMCPADVTVQSSAGAAVVVTYAQPAAAGGSAPVLVSCAPPSGSSFAPGATAVACTATDSLQRAATCGFSVRVTVPPRIKATRFTAFGDSITEGKPGPAPLYDFPGSYPARLQDMLSARYTAQSIVVTRQGNGGETTSDGVARLPAVLASDRPEVLLLVEGVNDLFGANRAAIAPALANLRQMIQLSKNAGAQVYLGTLTPQREGAYRASAYPVLGEFNRGLADLAAQTSCPLVDLFAALSPDIGSYVDWDGLHLTQSGYQKVAGVFFDRVQATLEIPGVLTSGGPSAFPGRVIPDGAPGGSSNFAARNPAEAGSHVQRRRPRG